MYPWKFKVMDMLIGSLPSVHLHQNISSYLTTMHNCYVSTNKNDDRLKNKNSDGDRKISDWDSDSAGAEPQCSRLPAVSCWAGRTLPPPPASVAHLYKMTTKC